MSDEKQQTQPGQVPVEGSQLEYYPPPPPGPPPSYQSQAPHQYMNDTSRTQYTIPAYDPSRPQFAPPPTEEINEADAPHQAYPHNATASQGVNTAAADGHAASKPGWGDRLSALGMKAAVPFNTLAEKLGSETFLPTTMDKECEKAARILRSFCSMVSPGRLNYVDANI